jgi:hypothetical protein
MTASSVVRSGCIGFIFSILPKLSRTPPPPSRPKKILRSPYNLGVKLCMYLPLTNPCQRHHPPVFYFFCYISALCLPAFEVPLLRAGSRRQASLRKTDAVGVREKNLSSGPAKPGKPLNEWIRIHSSRLFPSRSTRFCSCFFFFFTNLI